LEARKNALEHERDAPPQRAAGTGKTVEEIEKIMNIPQLDIINKLISMGFKPIHKKAKLEQTSLLDAGEFKSEPQKERKRKTHVTPEIEQRVVQLRKQRFNFSEIAKRTGVSQATASRIASKHGLPNQNRYAVTIFQQEPAAVAAGTSSESNNKSNQAICKELIQEAKTTLENTEPRKTFNSIGKALGYIEAALKLLEVEK
jgi:hypothetical protein